MSKIYFENDGEYFSRTSKTKNKVKKKRNRKKYELVEAVENIKETLQGVWILSRYASEFTKKKYKDTVCQRNQS